jgi:hypothetical protein
MSYTASQIANLARLIWEDIDSPSDRSVGFISGALVEPTFVAQINTKLNTSCVSTGGMIEGLGDDEAAIARLMYASEYFRKKSITALTSSGGYIYSAADGDTKWSREKASDTAKGYRELRKDTEASLSTAIHDYKLHHSQPVVVDSAQLSAFPSP